MSSETEKLAEGAYGQALRLPAGERDAFVAGLAETDPAIAELVRRRLQVADTIVDDLPVWSVRPEPRSSESLGDGATLDPTQDLRPDSHREPTDPNDARSDESPASTRQHPVAGLHGSDRPNFSAPVYATEILGRQQHPDRIAGYQILAILGRGGMGIVYRALQETPIRREVALKVLQPQTVSEQTLWRFDRERQTLALMSHPGVAQVFDAGMTADGQHYLVMELVRGERITDYCSVHHLDLRSRLELLIDVCDAVAHAHQKGILHRDLKPSNVLVQVSSGSDSDTGSSSSAKRAQVKVIDFGIAKLLDALDARGEHLTGTHQILGTPAYMSPERILTPTASGDTRSDVYSLGVLLFEMLTGHRPFEADNAIELLRKVEANTPRRPSRILSERLRSEDSGSGDRSFSPEQLEDLDWITLKALEREPARRYSSVAGLAEDLQNFLARRPVTARPPTRLYRTRRFVQRHRVAVILSTVAAVALVLGFVLATFGFLSARAAEDKFRQQARASEDVNDFLVDVLASADPSRTGQAVRVVDLLDRASETLASRLGEQPVRAAGIRRALGRTYLGLGDFDKAERELDQALELFEQNLGARDVQTLGVRRVLADLHLRQGHESDIIESLRTLLAELQDEVGDDHPEVFSTQIALAHALSWRGDHAAAEEILTSAIERQSESVGEGDENVLHAKAVLSDALLASGRFEQAEELARSILEMPVARPARIDFTALYVLAAASDMGGNLVAAEASFRRLYELQSRVLGDEHPTTLDSAYNLAMGLVANYRLEEGQELATRVFDQRQRLLGPDHPRTLSSQLAVGFISLQLGELAMAQENLSAGLEGSRRVLGETHPQTRNALDLNADCLFAAGDLEGAEALLREAVALDGESPEPYLWGSRASLGRLLVFRGLPEDGLAIHGKLLEDWQSLMPEGHPDVLYSQALLAASATAAGDLEVGSAAFEAARSGFFALPESEPNGMVKVGAQLLEASLIQRRPEAGRAVLNHLRERFPELTQRIIRPALEGFDRSYPGTEAGQWASELVSVTALP